jgi:predicted nucleotidyltransferase
MWSDDMFASIPKKPEDIFEPLCAEFEALYGNDLLSVILYGSCARGEYMPKKSDINVMLMLSEKGITQLGKALATIEKWRRRAVATPLLLTRSYIETSLDAFPIEFLNIQAAYRVLRGEDPLKSLVFDPRMLRLQCERELKGKLLQLRERFLETGGSARRIKELIARSLPTFSAIFQAVVVLHGKSVQPGREKLLNTMHQVLGLDAALFADLYAVREDRMRLNTAEAIALMERYIKEVRRLALAVDSLEGAVA